MKPHIFHFMDKIGLNRLDTIEGTSLIDAAKRFHFHDDDPHRSNKDVFVLEEFEFPNGESFYRIATNNLGAYLDYASWGSCCWTYEGELRMLGFKGR